nr:MAG TPA: hypothetical protein [Caudoviricetes sp.]
MLQNNFKENSYYSKKLKENLKFTLKVLSIYYRITFKGESRISLEKKFSK